jgi:superfamily II helicase
MGRIEREKKTIDGMLKVYCKAKHQHSTELCPDCLALQTYAHRRLDSCPFHESKPACNKCTVHCYSKKMRLKVKEVMRYAGPRMLLRHPVLTIMHMVDLIGKPPKLKGL